MPEVADQPITVEALATRIARLESELEELRDRVPEDKATILVFSGDFDKIFASFILATGAAALGQEVTMFFTFWGLSALKKGRAVSGKSLTEAMVAMMTPGSTRDLNPSKLSFMGAGAMLFRAMMANKGVTSLEDLVQLAVDSGIRFVACEMSMDVMGIRKEELRDGVELAGVATFLAEATRSRMTLAL